MRVSPVGFLSMHSPNRVTPFWGYPRFSQNTPNHPVYPPHPAGNTFVRFASTRFDAIPDLEKEVAERTNRYMAALAGPLALQQQELRQGRVFHHPTIPPPLDLREGYNLFPPAKYFEIEKNRIQEQETTLPWDGLEALRQVLANYRFRSFGDEVTKDQIIVTKSTSRSCAALIKALSKTADTPVFVPTLSVPKDLSLKLDTSTLNLHQMRQENPYQLQAADLESAFKRVFKQPLQPSGDPERGILFLVNPDNPTGKELYPQDIANITKVCKKWGVAIVCNEMYHEFSIFNQNFQHDTFYKHYPEHTYFVDAITKGFGIKDWKISWITLPSNCPPQTKNAIKDNLLFHQGSETPKHLLQQQAFAQVIGNESRKIEKHLQLMNHYYQAERAVLDQILNHQYGYDVQGKEKGKQNSKLYTLRFPVASTLQPLLVQSWNGFYLFLDFNAYKQNLNKAGIKTSIDLYQLLMRRGILGVPGSLFGLPKNNLTIRLSIGMLDLANPSPYHLTNKTDALGKYTGKPEESAKVRQKRYQAWNEFDRDHSDLFQRKPEVNVTPELVDFFLRPDARGNDTECFILVRRLYDFVNDLSRGDPKDINKTYF